MSFNFKLENYFYNNKMILNNINFSLNNGQIIFLNGKSGSGKSTIFKIISKEIENYNGLILLNNINIKDYNFIEYSKLISYLPQEYTLFKNINIKDQCLQPSLLKNLDKEKLELDFINLIKKFGLIDKIYSYPDELSGGQKQRVAIIKILLLKSKFIFLDEPTSALDNDNSYELFTKIKELSTEKTSFLISTHDSNFLNYFKNLNISEIINI